MCLPLVILGRPRPSVTSEAENPPSWTARFVKRCKQLNCLSTDEAFDDSSDDTPGSAAKQTAADASSDDTGDATKVSRPNPWKTQLVDRYWKESTDELTTQANAIIEKSRRLERKHQLSDHPDYIPVMKAWKRIQDYTDQYKAAVEDKEASKARTLSTYIESWVYELEVACTELHNRYAHVQEPTPGYDFISKRSNHSMIMSFMPPPSHCDTVLRHENLEQLIQWLDTGHKTKNVHCMRGPRGSGKSVLLHYIAGRALGKKGLFLATFSFPPGFNTELLEKHFLATILDELADCIPGLPAILSGIGRELMQRDPPTMDFNEQIDEMFIPALDQLPDDLQGSKILVILDGLDECDPESLGEVIEFMKWSSTEYPVRFLVSGRGDKPDAQAITEVAAEDPRGSSWNRVEENYIENFASVYHRAVGGLKKKGKAKADIKSSVGIEEL